MPKLLLKFGYNTYLLPDDTGVMTVVKALSRAVEVRDNRYFKTGIQVVSAETLNVEIAYVGGAKIHWPKDEPDRAEEEQLCLEEPKAIIIPPAK